MAISQAIWVSIRRIVPGPVGQRLAAGMRAAVAACARAGNDMVVDDVFVDPAWLDGWRSELTGLECLLVGVVAPLAVLEERESARGNRIAGEARFQFDAIHSGIEYDVTVDTAHQSPEECVPARSCRRSCADLDSTDILNTGADERPSTRKLQRSGACFPRHLRALC